MFYLWKHKYLIWAEVVYHKKVLIDSSTAINKLSTLPRCIFHLISLLLFWSIPCNHYTR